MENWTTLLDCNSLSVSILAILYSLRGPSVKSMSLQFRGQCQMLSTWWKAPVTPHFIMCCPSFPATWDHNKMEHMETEAGIQETLVTLKREMSFLPKGGVVRVAPELPKLFAHHPWWRSYRTSICQPHWVRENSISLRLAMGNCTLRRREYKEKREKSRRWGT